MEYIGILYSVDDPTNNTLLWDFFYRRKQYSIYCYSNVHQKAYRIINSTGFDENFRDFSYRYISCISDYNQESLEGSLNDVRKYTK